MKIEVIIFYFIRCYILYKKFRSLYFEHCIFKQFFNFFLFKIIDNKKILNKSGIISKGTIRRI